MSAAAVLSKALQGPVPPAPPEPPEPPFVMPPEPPLLPDMRGLTESQGMPFGQPPFPGGYDGPPPPIVFAFLFFFTLVVLALGIPFVRALARKWERQAAAGVPPEVERRLERIEQAVDAIAVEVERIGEGQRFTNQVVAELRGLPSGDAAAAERALLERANAARDRTR